MKAVRRVCAVIIGMVFTLAGLLKLMDPVGSGLVMEAYLNFFGLGLLLPAAKWLGVAAALFESLLGAALLAGVWRRTVAVVCAVALAFFTGLTLILWIKNPQMDCGCFGEALHLTHFQSFAKNVMLCLLWLIAFLPFSKLLSPVKVKYATFGIAAVSICAFCVYSLGSLPAMDFASFKPGTLLMQAQNTPAEGSPLLSISDAEGEYHDEMLADGAFLLVSVYDPENLDEDFALRAEALAGTASACGARPLLLSAGDLAVPVPPGLPLYYCDTRTLMALNRSNGGSVLLDGGIIVAKWPEGKGPSADRLAELIQADATEAAIKENTPRRLRLQGFLLYVFAVLLLL